MAHSIQSLDAHNGCTCVDNIVCMYNMNPTIILLKQNAIAVSPIKTQSTG